MTPLLFEDRAVIDANALGNAAVADTLLRLAGENAHEVYWSQQILEETKRFQLNRLNWEPHIVASYHVKLAESFPDAVVTDFEPLIAECTNDEGDRHVLAAAIKVCGHV